MKGPCNCGMAVQGCLYLATGDVTQHGNNVIMSYDQ